MYWRRRRFPFGNIGDELFQELNEFEQAFSEMWTEALRDPNARMSYYGVQVTTGPDGKPIVREFGNVKPTGGHLLQSGVREPLIDVNIDEKERKVKVVAEMPGASKNNINVNATDDTVTITANHDGKPYSAVVPINVKIDSNTAEASYTNGILEVVFKIKGSETPKGANIKVK